MLPINLVNDLGHQKLEAREWLHHGRRPNMCISV